MARASRPAAVTDSRLRRWLRAHRQALQQCSQQLRANRTGTLVTLLVIGVTLALPAALYVLVGNPAVVGDAWRGLVQLTLYLDDDLSNEQGEALATRPPRRQAIIQSGWKFIRNEEGSRELYHLTEDPTEEHNLIDSQVERANALEAQLETWHQQTPRNQASANDLSEEDLRMLEAQGYL